MALFKGTPTYYGEGAVVCRRRDRGMRDWFARLLGFPQTPNYQPPGRAPANEPDEPEDEPPFTYRQAPPPPTT